MTEVYILMWVQQDVLYPIIGVYEDWDSAYRMAQTRGLPDHAYEINQHEVEYYGGAG